MWNIVFYNDDYTSIKDSTGNAFREELYAAAQTLKG